MARSSAAPTQVEPATGEIAEAILEALAQVRAVTVGELREEMARREGDMEIDSREAEAVIAMLETRYDRTLAKVEDLEPECLPSVASLADLVHRRWPAGGPLAGGVPRPGAS